MVQKEASKYVGVTIFIIIILSAIPTMYQFMDEPEITTYNTTNIPDLNALLDSPPYEDNADAQAFNCTKNATRTFNITNNIGQTLYLNSWVTCPPIVTYNGNITVSYYFNGTLAGTTNMTNCNATTTNDVIVQISQSVPNGLYNVTWETNQCPATTPEGNLMAFGNATCTEPLDSNGQCLTYTNSSTTTGSNYVFIGLTTTIMSMLVLLLILAALGYAFKSVKK